MVRRFSVYRLACGLLTLAAVLLASPGGDTAAARGSAAHTRSAHRHRHGHGNRPHARQLEQRSAHRAAQRARAKSKALTRTRPAPAIPLASVPGDPIPDPLTATSLQPVAVGAPSTQTTAAAPAPAQAASTPPVQAPAVEEPSAAEPPAKEAPPREPPAQDPPGKEPPAQEPPVEEPPVKEPVVEDPPVEAPPAKEPPVTEPPVTEEPKAPAPPAGEPPLQSDPPSARKLVWSDEFNGPAGASPEASKWSFDTGGGGWGNDELESYTSRPANAELDGQGDLAITARAERYTGADGIARDYTSARLQTLNTFQFQYGLVEARIKVPAGQGLVGQFWALGHEAYEGNEGWPDCGEIDTMEVLGSEPNVVNGTLHAPWPWAPTGEQGSEETATALSAGFHVYGVEWEPERISFLLDGAVYKTITPADLPAGAAWPFKHPYFLLMDLAVGGEWPGSPNAATHFPAQMLVDWVRVWQ